jgi:hypothetical protein
MRDAGLAAEMSGTQAAAKGRMVCAQRRGLGADGQVILRAMPVPATLPQACPIYEGNLEDNERQGAELWKIVAGRHAYGFAWAWEGEHFIRTVGMRSAIPDSHAPTPPPP